MSHENVVVVGVDGSAMSKAALKWALAQAKARQARLHLVVVYELPSYAPDFLPSSPELSAANGGSHLYGSAKEMVEELAQSVEGQGVEVSWSLESGDPTEILVELSKKVALVVVGGRNTKGGRLADRLLRTVSSAVPSNACCPTVVITAENIDEVLPIRKIVVGVDGSEHSKMALQRAIWEADRWGAKLTAVATVNTAAAAWIPVESLREGFLTDVADQITKQIAEVDEGRDIDISVKAVEGNPAQILSDCSKDIDLLIIGTRGRGGFTGLLLGSTSQNVLANAKCPTMVVPRRVRPGDDVGPEPVQVVDD
ncbi:MAG: universal stress protein [Arcanobacterium sp.]